MNLRFYNMMLTENETGNISNIRYTILRLIVKIKRVISINNSVPKYVSGFFNMLDHYIRSLTYGIRSELIYKMYPELYLYAGILTILMISPYRFITKKINDNLIVNIIRKVRNGKILLFSVKKAVVFSVLKILSKIFAEIELGYYERISKIARESLRNFINNFEDLFIKKPNNNEPEVKLLESDSDGGIFNLYRILCIYTIFYANLALVLSIKTDNKKYINTIIMILVSMGIFNL